MKKNTQETKQYLQRALNNLPQDFALREARFHIMQALAKIEHAEDKRQNRAVLAQPSVAPAANPQAARDAIKLIDDMIHEEQNKLDQIRLKRQQAAQEKDDNQDGLSPILG
jgi:hypothetical protein